jgi:uncharacterized protein YndB with AHSA1/START domain
MNQEPIVLERSFHAPADKVWQALTDKNKMKQWYFDIENFKPELGLEFQFYGETDDKKKYLHLCKITELIPGEKLTHSWRYDGYPGESFVKFELFDEGENTRLKLTHRGLESFPATNPDLDKKNFVMGWNQIIGTNLPSFLEKS